MEISSLKTKSGARLLPTVIIIADPHAHIRNYSLLGREFLLKKPLPVKTKATGLDGIDIEETFYVIALSEYQRVVPEFKKDSEREEVLLPVYVCKPSFRPEYIAQT
jgi:hypothetical protein